MKNDFLYSLIKPFLFQFYPETSHEISLNLLKIANAIPGGAFFLRKNFSYSSERLKSTVNGIQFANPLGMAAGFDKTGEYFPYLEKMGFGFVEVGTITGEGQSGNPKPRIFRYPEFGALINRMGFNNSGSDFAHNILTKHGKKIPLGINIGKTKVVPVEDALGDYVRSYKKLCSLSDYMVINVSSPNTPGLRSLQDKKHLRDLMLGLKKELGGIFPVPTFVKLAPDFTDFQFEELVEEILDFGIHGIILTNTTLDKSALSKVAVQEGGLSGKPVREKSTRLIRLARKKCKKKMSIVGVGGVDSGESALEKILAGADLIQIYTGYIFQGPSLPRQILCYLDEFMEKNGVKNISEIVGA